MKLYVDYNFYKTKYHGVLAVEEFNNLCVLATQKIKFETFNRIEELSDEIKLCCCMIIDEMKKQHNTSGKASESVGKWSVSYTQTTNSASEIAYLNIIKTMLCDATDKNGTPLLYRGC